MRGGRESVSTTRFAKLIVWLLPFASTYATLVTEIRGVRGSRSGSPWCGNASRFMRNVVGIIAKPVAFSTYSRAALISSAR